MLDSQTCKDFSAESVSRKEEVNEQKSVPSCYDVVPFIKISISHNITMQHTTKLIFNMQLFSSLIFAFDLIFLGLLFLLLKDLSIASRFPGLAHLDLLLRNAGRQRSSTFPMVMPNLEASCGIAIVWMPRYIA
jgi:hypothetical protein